jgi:hypothetical protein
VDSGWNSAYPYAVGPTFYGVKTAAKIPSITEPVTVYAAPTGIPDAISNESDIQIFSVPASELVVIQRNDLTRENLEVVLYDLMGRVVDKTMLYQGSTIAYFDTKKLYGGTYVVNVGGVAKKVGVVK